MIFLYSLAFLAFFFTYPSEATLSFYNKALISGTLLLLVKPKYCFLPERHHIWFFVFLGWITICCICSEFPRIAILGYYLRMDGLITYFLITALAYRYWTLWRTATALRVLVFLLMSSIGAFLLAGIPCSSALFKSLAFTPVALGGVLSVMGVVLYQISPKLVLALIPLAVLSNTRTSLIAIAVSILCYVLFTSGVKKAILGTTCVIPTIVLLLFTTPLYDKMVHFGKAEFGRGARTQWAKQALVYSTKLPLTGVGLDQLHLYLKPAKGAYHEKGAIVDKTHNIALDILLTTGWIGLFIACVMLYMAGRVVYLHPNQENLLFASMIIGWLTFNMINPAGIYSSLLALIAYFGIRTYEEA